MSLDDLANEKDKVVLDKDEHNTLTTRAAMSLDDLAKEKDKVVLDKDEHNTLTTRAAMSLDDLANEKDKVVLDKDEHTTLTTRAAMSLDDLAKEKDKVVLDKDEHNTLTTRAAMSLEDLAREAEKILLPVSEHKLLEEKAQRSATERAAEEGLIALPTEEVSKMKETIANPSLEYLQKSCERHSTVLVPRGDYESLKVQASESLEEKAKKSGLALIESTRLQELNETVTNPTREHLHTKAKALGLVVVETAEFMDISQRAQRSLEDIAQEHHVKFVPFNEYEEMIQTVKNPSQDFLTKSASAQGYKVLLEKEYEELVAKSRESLEAKAGAAGMVVISQAEFSHLLNTHKELLENVEKLEVTNKEFLAERDSLNSQISTMLAKLDNPDLAYVKSKVENFNMTVLPLAEFNQFEQLKKSLSDVDRQLKKCSLNKPLVLVFEDEYRHIQTLAETSLEDRAKEQELVLLPAEEYSRFQETENSITNDNENLRKQIDSPDINYLKTKGESLGLAVIEKPQLEELEALANLSLEDRAAKDQRVLLTKEEYDFLNSPQLETLKTHSSRYDHAVIPIAEMDRLYQLESSPPISFINEHAEMNNLKLLTQDDHSRLVSLANIPLQDRINDAEMKLIKNEEYDDLIVKAHKPSLEHLTGLATSIGLSLVPIHELNEMRDILKQTLNERAEREGYVVLTTKEYELMKSNLQSLSEKANTPISARAEEEGYVLVSKPEYDQLNTIASTSLEDRAAESGLVMVNKSIS
ncbi:hypothetical protein LELG_04589 [Lodderomyces elongisporus NRRL YB-4239]|uniref:Uncharacterized protein n=1 Tax=Lodderomyces elongisporus (strain ATCC 11503 / CBS 2605 / JCM 1781 / NBRC 1676 / NRRL YB-4239) TaxID=379508 RepID=A5E4Q0_LODEL|nr:hypothetical protein LELG_04589 [Lodderomyces elongisporus NRRL YB-4239]